VPTTSDFLVIGSGIAGLTFALDAADRGTVTLITKRARDEANTARRLAIRKTPFEMRKKWRREVDVG